MRTFLDAKAMAKSLRTALSAKQLSLSHSECLEIVAAQFAVDDWNVLSARIDAASSASADPASVRLETAIPILRILSVEKAKEFYVDYLGFAIDWEHRFDDNAPLYAQVSRAGMRLHLSEHYGDAVPGSAVLIWMHGIEAFHRELSAKNYRYARPGLETMDYGARAVSVTDPFGNKLRFNEANKPDDPHA